ncbi:MAG: CapA family protein, partial [Chloroflexi bacterium]|nr:CapA family protein [Chloroflexota bacterium]
MLAVGDLMLGMPEPESYFSRVADVLRSGDIVIAHSEIPYTKSQFRVRYGGGPPQDPDQLRALKYAGINVVTLASNLLWDFGAPGVEDTVAWLRKNGIPAVGAGMNLDEARRPAIIEREGTRVGVLDYNCAGPKMTWATAAKPGHWAVDKPGCAYIHVISHYEEDPITPWRPVNFYQWAEPGSLQAMVDDIHNLRSLCDVLAVVLHKGVINVPAKVAEYERYVAHAAVDAGADLVLSHHAHILKGVELYKGKVIFHGLGNFVAVTAMSPSEFDRIALMRREVFNFEADPEYRTYLFHP